MCFPLFVSAVRVKIAGLKKEEKQIINTMLSTICLALGCGKVREFFVFVLFVWFGLVLFLFWQFIRKLSQE